MSKSAVGRLAKAMGTSAPPQGDDVGQSGAGQPFSPPRDPETGEIYSSDAPRAADAVSGGETGGTAAASDPETGDTESAAAHGLDTPAYTGGAVTSDAAAGGAVADRHHDRAPESTGGADTSPGAAVATPPAVDPDEDVPWFARPMEGDGLDPPSFLDRRRKISTAEVTG